MAKGSGDGIDHGLQAGSPAAVIEGYEVAGGAILHNADTLWTPVTAGHQGSEVEDMVGARKQDIALPDVLINTGVPTLHPLDDIFEIAHNNGETPTGLTCPCSDSECSRNVDQVKTAALAPQPNLL